VNCVHQVVKSERIWPFVEMFPTNFLSAVEPASEDPELPELDDPELPEPDDPELPELDDPELPDPPLEEPEPVEPPLDDPELPEEDPEALPDVVPESCPPPPELDPGWGPDIEPDPPSPEEPAPGLLEEFPPASFDDELELSDDVAHAGTMPSAVAASKHKPGFMAVPFRIWGWASFQRSFPIRGASTMTTSTTWADGPNCFCIGRGAHGGR
jgi:hypothetical protein